MNVFAKIVAGLGAVVFTATAVGLPDMNGYFTVREASASSTHHVVASTSQPQAGHAMKVSLRSSSIRGHWQLPI
jgi:hypothetical protein